MNRVSVPVRWVSGGVIVLVATAAALLPNHLGWLDSSASDRAIPAESETIAPELRVASGAAPCPPPDSPATRGPLAEVGLTCLADGRPAGVPTGKPTVLNVWAYWCQPCRGELPIVQQFADRAAGAVAVMTVHGDPSEERALSLLGAINTEQSERGATGIRLPGLQDESGRIRGALGAPQVFPVTVLLRPDGSVAAVHAQVFQSVAQLSAVVDRELGVRV